VKYTYDLNPDKAKERAEQLGAEAVTNLEMIFADPSIHVVLVFTPPFAREPYFAQAARCGKHVITTKPFAPDIEAARNLHALIDGKVECAVMYGRAGNAVVETLKDIFDSGEIGRLALYKEDWFHHYPTWNDWATDPKKNGGPFMDAMIHTLNRSRYLMGSKVTRANFTRRVYAQSLSCADTEMLVVDFESGGSAILFISWAADLEIHDPKGNDREHIGINHMITDKGWYVTVEEENGLQLVKAKKEHETRSWPVEPLAMNMFDDFVYRVENRLPQNHSVEMGMEDLRIIEQASRNLPVD
jgi:predicted dehydrogenase